MVLSQLLMVLLVVFSQNIAKYQNVHQKCQIEKYKHHFLSWLFTSRDTINAMCVLIFNISSISTIINPIVMRELIKTSKFYVPPQLSHLLDIQTTTVTYIQNRWWNFFIVCSVLVIPYVDVQLRECLVPCSTHYI